MIATVVLVNIVRGGTNVKGNLTMKTFFCINSAEPHLLNIYYG